MDIIDMITKYAQDVSTEHPDFESSLRDWTRIRDCIRGESAIKAKKEEYLPRPAGMSGEYADAYDDYIERAHFPQICAYALQGALGVIITKLPEFNVPSKLQYILKNSTKDGVSIQQLFLDCIIEVLETGRCPIIIDIDADDNKFKFVRYKAEGLINWKYKTSESRSDLILGVLKETQPEDPDNIFSHDTENVYRVLSFANSNTGVPVYASTVYDEGGKLITSSIVPSFMGKPLSKLPLFIAGSINNSFDVQPVPLLSVANCSVQIYRKEADLANSEFLSCNPTLVMVGVSDEATIPNVVGSSVLITLPDPLSRVFYTETDTAALTHVKSHITDLYEEAIRHGVSILDSRKGVESAEALRIRQVTQSASIYSMYTSVLSAIREGLYTMCEWGGYNKDEVVIDAPAALTYGIPDSAVIREVIDGLGRNVVPLSVVHRYLVGSGLLDQKVSIEEYKEELIGQKKFFEQIGVFDKDQDKNIDNTFAGTGKEIPPKKVTTPSKKEETDTEKEGEFTS